MKLIVYMDVYFLMNLFMNGLIVSIHSKLVKGRTNWIRILASSAIGALGGCFLIMIPMKSSILAFLFQYVGISYLMMKILYGKMLRFRLGMYMLAFYAIALFTGGTIQFLQWRFFKGNRSALILLTSGTLLYIIIRFVLLKWGGSFRKKKELYPVEVRYKEKTISGYGLYDTGNFLKEPISGKPVIIAEYEFLKELFTEDMKKELAEFPKYSKETDYSVILRWIPYHSIGNENGVLPGIEIDGIGIFKGNKKQWYENVYLALYKGKISNDHSYQFILHQEYMEQTT